MSYYKTCPLWGAHLDPGEKCDCVSPKERTEGRQMKPNIQRLADYLNQQENPERFMRMLLAMCEPRHEEPSCMEKAAQGDTNTQDGKAEQINRPVSA